jgi:hypothetical protein
MDPAKVKKYAAILEIIIIIIIFMYVIQSNLVKYYVEEVKANFNEQRQNPLFIFTSSLFGQSSENAFQSVIGQKVTALFKEFISFLLPVFSGITSMFSGFQDGINGIRNILKPIRDFFKSAAETFYKQLQNFTIGILYSLHKIRNTMKRSLSGFNLLYHSLEHNKNTIESIINSEPVKLAEKLIPKVEFIAKRARRLGFCFEANTSITLVDGTEKLIRDLVVGDILKYGIVVTATHEFNNYNSPLFNYNDILVSGNHIVFHNGKWIRIKDCCSKDISNIECDRVYCISTDKCIIPIKDMFFRDYSESNNIYLNARINRLILNLLNNGKHLDYSYPVKYLDQGFHEDTKVVMEKGIKKIKDIQIGDILKDGNEVVGKVELEPNSFSFYSFNGVYVSSNMKVLDGDIWKNVERTNSEQVDKPKRAFNLVTSNRTIYVSVHSDVNTKEIIVFRDYTEATSDTSMDTIQGLVIKHLDNTVS